MSETKTDERLKCLDCGIEIWESELDPNAYDYERQWNEFGGYFEDYRFPVCPNCGEHMESAGKSRELNSS